MRHVVSALVQNVPGVLAHISGMLASRGFNIDSLAVGETEEPELSRMTFVVVGGGPTGVELAGALSEIARHTIRNDFRHIHPEDARIVIVEAAEHVLAHYPEDLCKRAAQSIRDLGIEIHTKTRVTKVTEDEVYLSSQEGDQVIGTQTVLWAAGVHGSPLGSRLAIACGTETDRSSTA